MTRFWIFLHLAHKLHDFKAFDNVADFFFLYSKKQALMLHVLLLYMMLGGAFII